MSQRSEYTHAGLSFFGESVRDAMWRDAPHPALISPAVGFGRWDDFLHFLAADWTITAVSAGTGTSTFAPIDGAGGLVRINTAANEDDGAQAQSVAEIIKLTAGQPFWFDALVNLTDEEEQSDAIVGIAVRDTTLIASAPTDGVYWRKDDGDANWDFVSRASSTGTERTALATAVADEFVLLGFKYDGASIQPYFNGAAIGEPIATNVPTTELALSFAYLNGAGTAQNEGLNIDFYRYAALRG